MNHPLDNPVWHALCGPHRHLAKRHGLAAHYPRDFAAFSAIAEPSTQAAADLAHDLPVGMEARLVVRAPAPVLDGWTQVKCVPLLQLVAHSFDGTVLDRPPTVTLGLQDDPAVQALVELTQPGPFAAHTMQMGHFLGVMENGHLVAMAGERMRLDRHVELSAICTHPQARGRRLAEHLMRRLMRDALERGQTPFLHVLAQNASAISLYKRLGFVFRADMHFAWYVPMSSG